MAVKIRLARKGRRKRITFNLVIADARAPRDGRFIEKIGRYNPLTVPADIHINEDRALHWLIQGAQPSNTVKAMLSYRGVMLKKHLQIGVIKGAITQEQADAKMAEWLKEKETKIQAKRDEIAKGKEDAAKSRKDAEQKIKEARTESIRKKETVKAEKETVKAEKETVKAEKETVKAEKETVKEETKEQTKKIPQENTAKDNIDTKAKQSESAKK